MSKVIQVMSKLGAVAPVLRGPAIWNAFEKLAAQVETQPTESRPLHEFFAGLIPKKIPKGMSPHTAIRLPSYQLMLDVLAKRPRKVLSTDR